MNHKKTLPAWFFALLWVMAYSRYCSWTFCRRQTFHRLDGSSRQWHVVVLSRRSAIVVVAAAGMTYTQPPAESVSARGTRPRRHTTTVENLLKINVTAGMRRTFEWLTDDARTCRRQTASRLTISRPSYCCYSYLAVSARSPSDVSRV